MANSEVWLDRAGVPINAHAGGMLWHKGRYYWFGQHMTEGYAGRLAWHGVHCYSSTDLLTWEDEGLALAVSDAPESPIARGQRIERPKVLFNALTGKFVMWFHSTDEPHTLARAGLAIADQATGPYVFVRSARPDAGAWPLDVRPEQQSPDSIAAATAEGEPSFKLDENDKVRRFNILGRDFRTGQQARDMGLFQDDDDHAYLLYASEHNSTLHISRLTADYRAQAGMYSRAFEHRWMEAPALFKRNGRYYLLMSGCTSWEPNAARGAVADHILGPWREIGNPCRGINPGNGLGPERTFGCQSTFVLRLPGTERWVAMFDLWNSDNFIDSRYVWLPIRFTADGYEIQWQEHWAEQP